MAAWEVEKAIFKTRCMERRIRRLNVSDVLQHAGSSSKMERVAAADQPEVCTVSLQQTVSLRALSDR